MTAAELVGAEAGEHAHKGAEADAHENQTHNQQGQRGIHLCGIQNHQADHCDDNCDGQGVDPAQLVGQAAGDQTAGGIEQTEDGDQQRRGGRGA